MGGSLRALARTPDQRSLRLHLGRRDLPRRRPRSRALVPARRDRRPGRWIEGTPRPRARLSREYRELGGRPALAARARPGGDGALGLWAALRTVYPSTRHQRCWNHRAMNLADKLPKRLGPEFRARFRALYLPPPRIAREAARDALAGWPHAQGQDPAAETLFRDWDDFVTFYDFPAEHWLHLRTCNPIESVFAGVRLRTDVAT